jgi:hypothetical protein
MKSTNFLFAAKISACVAALALAACGGSSSGQGAAHAENALPMPHACGNESDAHHHEIDPDQPGQTEAFVPCSKDGAGDYSGVVHVESESDGLHISIDATDDDFKEGVFGSDLKGRDAVLVYPKGRDAKAVEVPLTRTPDGYRGEKVISYDELDTLTDQGTKLDIGVFDHDQGAAEHEEMHVHVDVSTGESCEKAIDENPQTMDMTQKGSSVPDLTDDQLAGPVQTSSFFSNCSLADSAKANICVAIKYGKPLGVTVLVSPSNKRVAACIDRATRKLSWPSSAKLDIVHQAF